MKVIYVIIFKFSTFNMLFDLKYSSLANIFFALTEKGLSSILNLLATISIEE